MTRPAQPARSERGFSMFIVIVALFVTSMFVAAAFAAANGDLPVSADSKDRKATFAAAEAGLNYYETQLNHDPDFWTHCEQVTVTAPNPVNKVWNGVGSDPRTWRNVTPGAAPQYTIEILPANGNPVCLDGQQSTVLDQKTGTFRIRVTGRPRVGSKLHRSIVATFKRKGFLDYLWYTKFEDQDPQAFATQTERTAAQNNCAEKYRPDRTSSACKEIQWITGDVINGPMHSNDSFLICNSPTFGRDTGDTIEVVPTTNPRVAAGGCQDKTNMLGLWKTGVQAFDPPTDDQPLAQIAQQPGGAYYTGKTIIRLAGNQMTVTNSGSTSTRQVPTNGVVYVAGTGSCLTQYPAQVNYSDNDSGCGNVYVSGQYNSNLTIAADNDVIIAPTAGGTLNWGSTDEALTNTADAVLGLIANRFVRVGHSVTRGSNGCNNVASGFDTLNLTVQAAILALQHSFITDNYDCDNAGKLQVNGAIAQYYRGPVGTGGHATGFLKAYSYDNRLRYRSPPYFLTPIAAQWSVIRDNEQLPAR
jgi:hypothetical protein